VFNDKSGHMGEASMVMEQLCVGEHSENTSKEEGGMSRPLTFVFEMGVKDTKDDLMVLQPVALATAAGFIRGSGVANDHYTFRELSKDKSQSANTRPIRQSSFVSVRSCID